jgi:hypothetical protein
MVVRPVSRIHQVLHASGGDFGIMGADEVSGVMWLRQEKPAQAELGRGTL